MEDFLRDMPGEHSGDSRQRAGIPTSTSLDRLVIEAQVTDVLHTIYDPEIPVDIYELGLIYGVSIEDDGTVDVVMTLTAPSCPAAQSLPEEVDMKLRGIPAVSDVRVHIVFEPPWDMSRMSDAARLKLGFM